MLATSCRVAFFPATMWHHLLTRLRCRDRDIDLTWGAPKPGPCAPRGSAGLSRPGGSCMRNTPERQPPRACSRRTNIADHVCAIARHLDISNLAESAIRPRRQIDDINKLILSCGDDGCFARLLDTAEEITPGVVAQQRLQVTGSPVLTAVWTHMPDPVERGLIGDERQISRTTVPREDGAREIRPGPASLSAGEVHAGMTTGRSPQLVQLEVKGGVVASPKTRVVELAQAATEMLPVTVVKPTDTLKHRLTQTYQVCAGQSGFWQTFAQPPNGNAGQKTKSSCSAHCRKART